MALSGSKITKMTKKIMNAFTPHEGLTLEELYTRCGVGDSEHFIRAFEELEVSGRIQKMTYARYRINN